ncbi:MAG: D-alanyl-D-alanine carboxypeptidase/D-alanyl-D-alanine-endopeptidase [Bdellovibrionota bacterium]
MNKLLLATSLIFSTAPAFADPAPAAIAADIKALLAPRGSKVSMSLRDPDGGEVVSHQGELSLSPASIAKTVSTACSLDALGPQFQFTTNFGFSGKVTGDTLDGDLVIKGHGDPSLVIEDLHEVVEKLRHVHGIRKITGGIVFDVSYFGKKGLAIASGFEGDEGRSFTADLTPVTFNQNSFSVWVTPDVRNRAVSRATALPAGVLDLQVTNNSKTGGSTEVNLAYDPAKMKATVVGVIGKEAEPKGIYRAVDDAYQYAQKLMQRLWIDSGGEWKSSQFKISTTPVASTQLYKYSSRPLSKILIDVNKLSLNLGAEMIFLAAGSEKYGTPASYEKALKMLGECLSEKSIEAGALSLTNGSGLSREARIKPTALTKFLRQAALDNFAPEYLASFSILGIDGTARARLKNYAGRARLKTGSLKDVRSIAGFLYSKDHKPYAFTMIQNGVSGEDAKVLEDRVMEAFLKKY